MPYCYYIDDKRPDIIKRVNENWARLWIIKSLKSWEQIVSYDYKIYAVKNTVTGTIKEYCLFDLNVPSIEKIQGELKCGSH
jgi:hypothetical protein